MARLAAVLREENARLRAENAEQAAELERVRADLAVLQRMVFGRSSERARPEPSADGGDAGQGRDLRGSGTGGKKRGPGARAGRRDYSHLPRVEVVWDFGGGGYCCPECGTPFTGLGSDHVTEQLDWLVIVRVRADCRRWYRRACSCQVPATVTAPGPPKAIGKGLFTNAFLAMLFTERYVARRTGQSLLLGAHPQVLRAGRRREPRPADVLDGSVAGAGQGPVRGARAAHDRLGAGRGTRAAGSRRGRRPAGGGRRRLGRGNTPSSTRPARSR